MGNQNHPTIIPTNSIGLRLGKPKSILKINEHPIFQGEIGQHGEVFFKSGIKNDLYYVLLIDGRVFHFDGEYYESLQEACLIGSLREDEVGIDQTITNKNELLRLHKSILNNIYKDEPEISDEEHERTIQEYHKYLAPPRIESMLDLAMRDINNPEDMKSHLKWIIYVYENNVYLKKELHNNLRNKVKDRLKQQGDKSYYFETN